MSQGKYRKVQTIFLFNKKKKIRKFDKGGAGNIITISYEIKFIDSARYMAS